jgi:hypothetical protein
MTLEEAMEEVKTAAAVGSELTNDEILAVAVQLMQAEAMIEVAYQLQVLREIVGCSYGSQR